MVPIIEMDTATGADAGLSLIAQGRGDQGPLFKIQMLRQIQVIPKSALGYRLRLMGLDHVGKGQLRRLVQGVDIGSQGPGLGQEQPHKAVHGIAHIQKPLLRAVKTDGAGGMTRQMDDFQCHAAQIESMPLPYRGQFADAQGQVLLQTEIHGDLCGLQLRHAHFPSVVLPAEVHVQRMDISPAKLFITAGVVHMTVGVDHIEGFLRNGLHQPPKISKAVARVKEQCVVCTHDQVHKDHAVSDAEDAGLQLPDGVDIFLFRHGAPQMSCCSLMMSLNCRPSRSAAFRHRTMRPRKISK